MQEQRENWIATVRNGKYVVVDKMTNSIIYDAQGHGFKNESKCRNWIRNQQRHVGITMSEEPVYNPLF